MTPQLQTSTSGPAYNLKRVNHRGYILNHYIPNGKEIMWMIAIRKKSKHKEEHNETRNRRI